MKDPIGVVMALAVTDPKVKSALEAALAAYYSQNRDEKTAPANPAIANLLTPSVYSGDAAGGLCLAMERGADGLVQLNTLATDILGTLPEPPSSEQEMLTVRVQNPGGGTAIWPG